MSASSRAIALITSLWLVIGGVLGARHEARAAHFVDGHGVAFHGSRMAGEHTADHSDVHSRDAAPDHDACGITTALHKAAVHSFAPGLAVGERASVLAPRDHAVRLVATTQLFRIAPKTSPPTTLA